MNRRIDALFGTKPAARAATIVCLVGGLLGLAPGVAANGAPPDPTIPPIAACSIHLCQPDLQVTYAWPNYGFGKLSSYYSLLQVDVTNTGSADAGPFNVAVRGLPGRPFAVDGVLQTFTVSGLKAGATTQLEYYPLHCPTQTTRVVVDPSGAVTESDEDNNERAAAFKIVDHCIYP